MLAFLRKFRSIVAGAAFVAVFIATRSGLRGYATALLLAVPTYGLVNSVGLYLTTDRAKGWVRFVSVLLALLVFVAVGGVPFTDQTATDLLGEERANEVEAMVNTWVAARVETPLAERQATIQADPEAPEVLKWVVGAGYEALQPTPTETPVGFVAPPTPTSTPVPGQVQVTVMEKRPSGLLEAVIGKVEMELLLEPEGRIIEASKQVSVGTYTFSGEKLEKGRSYRIEAKAVPPAFAKGIKILVDQEVFDPVFNYTGEAVAINLLITRN